MKTIAITGSTRGIGLGLATEFLKRDANVIVCGRGEEGVNKAWHKLSEIADASRVLAQTCDVTGYEDVQKLWENGIERFGQIDIFINNAGSTTRPVKLHEIPQEEFGKTINAKLLGAFYGAHVAINGMLGQPNGGQIYFMEGMGGKDEVQEGMTTLGATNRAIVYMVKSLIKEYKDSNLIFCKIRPGINITDHLLKGVKYMDKERWEKSKKVLNILGDTPETTTPYLAEKILANKKNGAMIAWLSTPEITKRFLTAPFNKRDLLGQFEIDDPGAVRSKQ